MEDTMMKPGNILSISLGLSVLLLSGCLHESSNDDSTSLNSKLTGNQSVLEGTWSKGCAYNADDEDYSKEAVTFSGNNFTISGSFYADASCSSETMSMVSKGTFAIGDSLILTSGTTVNKVDVTIVSNSLTLGMEDLVSEFNFYSVCGKNNWETNVAVDVTNCQDLSGPNKFYDIFKIDGNKLIFGDDTTGDTESENTRPTALDVNDYFTKK